MSRSIFVSFVFEESTHFATIEKWAREGRLGPDTVVTGETKDVRQQGEAAIRSHLQPKIRGAAAVLLLLGNSAHNHDWVHYELQVAATLGKRVVMARLPGSTGAPPPDFRHLPEIAFEPSAIARALG